MKLLLIENETLRTLQDLYIPLFSLSLGYFINETLKQKLPTQFR